MKIKKSKHNISYSDDLYRRLSGIKPLAFVDMSKELVGRTIKVLNNNEHYKIAEGIEYKVEEYSEYGPIISWTNGLDKRTFAWRCENNCIHKYFTLLPSDYEIFLEQIGKLERRFS